MLYKGGGEHLDALVITYWHGWMQQQLLLLCTACAHLKEWRRFQPSTRHHPRLLGHGEHAGRHRSFLQPETWPGGSG